MSKGTVPCLVCGVAEGKKTLEHAFPQWLEHYVPSLRGRQYVGAFRGSPEDPRPAADPGGHRILKRPMPIGTFEQTVGNVCDDCNNRVLNGFEEATRPLLAQLLTGGRPRLTYADQVKLATWGWKTAAMLNRVESASGHAVPAEEFRWLHDHRRPPRRAEVWMGAWDGQDPGWSMSIGGAQAVPGEGPPPALNTYVIFFGIGTVFFCVSGTSATHLPGFELPPVLNGRVRRVWPVGPGQRFTWPPGEPVGDEQLLWIADRMPEYMRNLRIEVERAMPNRWPGPAWQRGDEEHDVSESR